MPKLTWHEQLEHLQASRVSLGDALSEMRSMDDQREILMQLESICDCVEHEEAELRARIEARDSREDGALEREYYRNLI